GRPLHDRAAAGRLREALRPREPRRFRCGSALTPVTRSTGKGTPMQMAKEESGETAVAPSESNEEVRRLVERGQQGDREALEELYLLHFDRIYSYLHMSVGNRHDAEDLTTQTFMKMLESIKRFRWQSAPFS